MTWQELEKTYGKWIDLYDKDLLRIIYGVCIANRFLDGKPVWLIVIGPSGSGKTEVLNSLEECKWVVSRDSLTALSLATASADGDSLLYRLDKRILIIRDFSSVSSLHAEQKNQLFSFLRAAYDGVFTRSTGRKDIEWTGKFGLIAATTSAIEREQIVMGALGERFLYLRINPVGNMSGLLDRVITNVSSRNSMDKELRKLAIQYWSQFQMPQDRKLPSSLVSDIKDYAIVITKCRSSVIRDAFTKEIVYPIEDGEVPTRLLQQLILLALGIKATGADPTVIKRTILRVARDCIPYTRLRILQAIHKGFGVSTSSIAKEVKVSRSIVDRHLEEMSGLDLVRREGEWIISTKAIADVLS